MPQRPSADNALRIKCPRNSTTCAAIQVHGPTTSLNPKQRRSVMALADELWLVDFGDPYPREPASHRPALVLGPPETFGPGFPFVIVTPLTTRQRGLSLHVEIEANPETGLEHTSYAQCELIRSINRTRLLHRLGAIGPEESSRVASVIKTLLSY